MTRGIGSLIPEVEDEIDRAFSAYWGTDEGEWTDVVVFETMMKAVARATNRIFVGSELCKLHSVGGDWVGRMRQVMADCAPQNRSQRGVSNELCKFRARYHAHFCSVEDIPGVV